MQPLQGIKLIIFDLDGVLVDTLPDIALAVKTTAEHMGCRPLTLAEAGGFVGGGAKRAFVTLLGPERADEVPAALEFFRDFYTAHCADTSVLYPGVREVLAHFHGRVKMTLATAKIRPAAEHILQTFGIAQHFDLLVTADEMERMKPDPQCVEITLEKLGIAPGAAVMVGDMKTDVQASKAAGIASVAVSSGYGKLADLQASEPDYLIDDLMALRDVIAV